MPAWVGPEADPTGKLKAMSRFLLMLWCAGAMAQTLVIRTSTVIDGKGHVLRGQEIVLEGGRIARIADAKQKPDIDLTGMTVMPGWIDTHVHVTWYFNREGRLEQGPGRNSKSTPQQAALFSAANLYRTLQGGFTTVQSVGAAVNADVRDRINHGSRGSRDRAFLRRCGKSTIRAARAGCVARAGALQTKADGADVIKLFATAGSVRAARNSDERRADPGHVQRSESRGGLRSVVHAI